MNAHSHRRYYRHDSRSSWEESIIALGCCNAEKSGPGRAEARRQRLIEAARTLFAQHGFNGTGMAQIATESGIKIGQIYRDFESKEHLIGAIVQADLNAFLNEAALHDAAARHDLDAVRRWLTDFVGAAGQAASQRLILEICAESTRNDRVGCIMQGIDRQVRGGLTTALTVFAPQPEKAARVAVTVDLILTLKIGMANQGASAPPRDLTALRARVAELIAAEVDALVH